MNINLVIQETTAGLNIQYISGSFDINLNQIKATLNDERMLATQIANQSTVYSVQAIESIKVYSAIYTNISDFTGRSGYYAIKLYCDKDSSIKNILDIFNELNESYLNFKSSGQLNNQSYNDILSKVIVAPEKPIICRASSKICFTYYTNIESLINIINHYAIHSIEKLYIFDKSSSRVDNEISQQGLTYFEDYLKDLESFEIINVHGGLQSLFFNNYEISKYFPDSFFSLKKKDDFIYYKTSDDNKKQQVYINNGILTIGRKAFGNNKNRDNISTNPENKTTFSDRLKIPLIALSLTTLIGWGSYFILRDPEPIVLVDSAVSDTSTNNSVTTLPPAIEEKNREFEFVDSNENGEFKCSYNEDLKTRIFFKDKDNKCRVKKQNIESSVSVKRSYIIEKLNIKEDEIETFIKKLEQSCGCSVVNVGSNNDIHKYRQEDLQKAHKIPAEPQQKKPLNTIDLNTKKKNNNSD